MRTLCVAIFILIGSAAAADRPYAAGRLEKIEITDLSTTVTVPPLVQNSSGFTLPIPLGVAYQFTLNSDGIAYLAACVSKAKKSFAADWVVNDPVQFRIDKAKLYLKRPNGKLLRLGLIKRTRILNPDGTDSKESAIPGATSHQNIPECR
jgi:hypothetical protein